MQTKLRELMTLKQLAEGRVINPTVVAAESGISRATVHKWLSGDLRRFDEKTAVAFCQYFGVDLGSLLYVDWALPERDGQ